MQLLHICIYVFRLHDNTALPRSDSSRPFTHENGKYLQYTCTLLVQDRGLHGGSSELDSFVGRRLKDGRVVASVFNKTPLQTEEKQDRVLKIAEYILARYETLLLFT